MQENAPPHAERPRVGLDYRPALFGAAGIARATTELARALADLGGAIDLRLFGHAWRRARSDVEVPVGARLRRWRMPARLLPTLRRLGVGADDLSGGVDVFHWTDYVHPPVRRARIVLTVHDLVFAEDSRFHGAVVAASLLARTRRAVERADAVVVPSRATADALFEHVPSSRGKRVHVIPWGCDHDAGPTDSSALPQGLGDDFVLCVGTIEPRKNHDLLLRAWSALDPATRPPLVVLGREGWECAETVARLVAGERQSRGSRAPLTWLRDADDATRRACIAHCAALAYPSRGEGFGFPPLEAFHLGRPVLAADVPALREVLGDAATLLPAGDEAAWRHAIAGAGAPSADSDAERRRREHAARFSWAACARAHAALYRELAGRGPRGARR
jgi:glycosyltransferase involved in cell wall biosynthesis